MMTVGAFWCPWCQAEHFDKPCVHVKEVKYSKYGRIQGIVFRDLTDMPQEMVSPRYSLADLYNSDALIIDDLGQKDVLEYLCRAVCDGEHSRRTFISLVQEMDQIVNGKDEFHVYRVTFAYKDRVFERVLKLSPRESPGPAGRIAHQLMPIDDLEFAAAPFYTGKENSK